MATVLFVHGTGVRGPKYSEAFVRIQKELASCRSDFESKPCLWGDALGAKLNAEGLSVPLYDSTLGLGEVSEEDYEVALWSMLYQDPLYELRALALGGESTAAFAPNRPSPGQALEARVRSMPVSEELRGKIEAVGIDEVFESARAAVINSDPFRGTLTFAPESLNLHYSAVARAIIAQAIEEKERQQGYAIEIDVVLRDEIIAELSRNLGRATLASVKGWIGKQLFGLAVRLGAMDHVQRKRGALTDATYPAAGDILLYQGRGAAIRDFIRDRIQEAAGPVLLLAHSLGGIACVDLLVMEKLPKVKLLVTVGSQAPFLYEINALHSLAFGDRLPEHFPTWLNIYNLRDLLSYVGASVFPTKVQDVQVQSKQPFPQSHSDYWNIPATWKAIDSCWNAIKEA